MTKAKQKTATKRPKEIKPGTSPINGLPPPAEYRFKDGNPGGPGRPRGLKWLAEKIQAIGEKQAGKTPEGEEVTLLESMIERMYKSKNASDHDSLFGYGYGKPIQRNQEFNWIDEAAELLIEGKVTEEIIKADAPEHFERIIATAKLRGYVSSPMAGASASEG